MKGLRVYIHIKAVGDSLLVEPLSAMEVTASGLHIPEAAQSSQKIETMSRAVVRAVGQGILTDNGGWVDPGVRVGDLVYFGNFAGSWVKFFDEQLLTVRMAEVAGCVPAEHVDLHTHQDGLKVFTCLVGEPCHVCMAEEREAQAKAKAAAEAEGAAAARAALDQERKNLRIVSAEE